MMRIEWKHFRLRMLIVGIFFSVLYGIILAKVFYVQVVMGPSLSRKAADQYTHSIEIYGKRGTIYDARQREMAVSVDITSIAASPKNINNVKTTARMLARILHLNTMEVQKKLASGRSFAWIKRHVGPKEVEELKALNLTGIDFLPEHSRVYPNRGLAAQVLGFSGIDGQGLEGLEYIYNDVLQGEVVENTVLRDAQGRGFHATRQLLTDHSGNNLILTIDRTVQYIAENALEEAATTFRAKSGIAIVMDPKTGAFMAVAHYPRFNPNVFSLFDQKVWRDRAVTDPFEPGSTMKIFLAAAAINSGQCTPSTLFYCEDGSYRVDNAMVHDTHPHGWLSFQQIIKYSSNIGTVKISEMIGKRILYRTLKDFGFGTKTGIDCPGETNGTLRSQNRWSRIDTGAISFGQGISVSAVQLASATSAIANNGVLMRPHIVKAITGANGRLIKNFSPEKIRSVISPEAAATIRRIMKTVVTEGGTGVNAALEGYSVCGKTGTAQKIDGDGLYSKDKYTASFVGFLPADNPELTILVVLDEPREDHYGGIVAAPAFKRIAQETLNYLNIPPDNEIGPGVRGRMTVSIQGDTKG